MSERRLAERHEIPEAMTWDLTDVFESKDAWREAFDKEKAALTEASSFRGEIHRDGEKLLQYLRWEDEHAERIGKIYTYAHLLRDQDARHTEHLGMEQEAASLAQQFAVVTSWSNPEMMQIEEATLAKWLEDVDGLRFYEQALDAVMRFKPHTLSGEEEQLMALASEALQTGSNAFSALNDADITFPDVTDDDGEKVELTQGRFGRLLKSEKREVREEAFRTLYATYKQYKNTFAATLGGTVSAHVFNAEARNFEGTREAAVFANAIPESVYQNLLDSIDARLDLLHRYVALRKKILGIDDLRPYDMYVSLVEDVDLHFTYEEACELVIKALAPLGKTYTDLLRKAFDERWIDVMENRGKRSGAYSSGTYGTNPHILLNWNGTLDAVFTLAHELGHSLHSYLTWDTQAFRYGNYGIFLAEIASTTNENLLTHYLLETYDDPKVKAYVINHYLDGFKGTVFRQTQFADFEYQIHRRAEKREPLTAEGMSALYGEINRRYYGDALTEDEDIAHEWMRIPHFYYDFYVYQYATGFSAATAFTRMIQEEGQPAVDRYLAFLSAGCSDYPIDVLKTAGLDMTTPDPIMQALDSFEDYLGRFEAMAEKGEI